MAFGVADHRLEIKSSGLSELTQDRSPSGIPASLVPTILTVIVVLDFRNYHFSLSVLFSQSLHIPRF